MDPQARFGSLLEASGSRLIRVEWLAAVVSLLNDDAGKDDYSYDQCVCKMCLDKMQGIGLRGRRALPKWLSLALAQVFLRFPVFSAFETRAFFLPKITKRARACRKNVKNVYVISENLHYSGVFNGN